MWAEAAGFSSGGVEVGDLTHPHSENIPEFSARNFVSAEKVLLLMLFEFSCRGGLFLLEVIRYARLLWFHAESESSPTHSENAPEISAQTILPKKSRWLLFLLELGRK